MIVKGICLRAIDYREKDKLMTLATLEGKVTVIARGVKSSKAKLKAGCMPMVFGDFEITKKGGILTGVDIEENFHNCWTDTHKNLAALLVMEILEKVTLENQDISREIVMALKALREINYNDIYPFAPTVWFFVKILQYAGVDYSVEDLPVSVAKVLEQMTAIDANDIQTLDITISDIMLSLDYLNLIIKNQLSINLHIIKQIKLHNP